MNEYSREEPIFNRLARERGYETLIGDGPHYRKATESPFSRPANPEPGWVTAEEALASMGLSAESIRRVMQKVEPQKARLVENIHLKDLIGSNVSLEEHIAEMTKRFKRKYPNVKDIDLTRKDELDGTVTLVLSERSAPVVQTDEDVNAAPPKSVFVKKLSELQENDTPSTIEEMPHPQVAMGIMDEIISGARREFYSMHPNALITGMTPKKNGDGSMVMQIEAIEPVSPIEHNDLLKIKSGEMTIDDLKAKLSQESDERITSDPDETFYAKTSDWRKSEE